jgi:hypothetical protein
VRKLLLVVVVVVASCGPAVGTSDDDDDHEVDARTDVANTTATLTGTVWAPGMAPGMVPPEQEIPIAGALVTLSIDRPPPIPAGVYCERCIDTGTGVLSDAHGHFTMVLLEPGTYWLVIQKGQFRLEQPITLERGARTLVATETTLPGQLDVAGGKTIPHIAVAVGNYDSIQDVVGKLGIGEVASDGGLVNTLGEMDLYTNGGPDLGVAMGTLTQLVSDLDRLRQYHIVFIPCASTSNVIALRDQNNLRNLRRYVEEGGRLYVTDWSGEWMDNVFPAQIELGETVATTDPRTDTPSSAYDPQTDTWDTTRFGNADGEVYVSSDAEATDPELAAWLEGQVGPRGETGGDVGLINPMRFAAYDNWNWIVALTPIVVGTDDLGADVIDTPRAWVSGSGSSIGGPTKRPLTVTFNPPGCGRVLFSTYHTAPGTHQGLLPQERVLLYLIFEIGVCNDNPPIE